jgi:type II secretory pathway component PulF
MAENSSSESVSTWPAGRQLSAADLSALNEQIAAMARAGLPLERGLRTLAQDIGRGKLRRVLEQVADDLNAGMSLPEALERHSGLIPSFYPPLILAGIRSGRLAEVLATLSSYSRKVEELRNSLRAALIYPLIVLLFCAFVLVLISRVLVPSFETLYADTFGRTWYLDDSVEFQHRVGFAIARHPFLFIGTPLLIPVVAYWLIRFALGASRHSGATSAQLIYSVPIVGEMLRAARMAGYVELLRVLVENQIPLPEAITLAGRASRDPIVAAATEQIRSELESGRPLADALRRPAIMPEMITWMIATAEKRGDLTQVLEQAAEFYTRKAEQRIVLARNVIPSLVVVLSYY